MNPRLNNLMELSLNNIEFSRNNVYGIGTRNSEQPENNQDRKNGKHITCYLEAAQASSM